MIDRATLANQIGPMLTMAGREQLRRFRDGGELFLAYEHVKDWGELHRLVEGAGLDLSDGSQGVEVLL